MRYLKHALAVLLLASAAHAQTLGNTKIAIASASTNTFSLTGVSYSQHSTVWVFFGYNDSCYTSTFTVADSNANAFTAVGSLQNRTYTCSQQFYLKDAPALSGGSITVTSAGGATSGMTIGFVEIIGADQTAPLEASGFGNEGSGSVSTSSALSAAGGALVVAGVIDYYSGDTLAAANGFTIPPSGTVSNAAGSAGIEYQIVAAGSYTPSFTVTGSNYTTILAASFKASGAPPATATRRRMIQ
jgi:hypothetical protein